MTNLNQLVSDFAAAQLLAIRLSQDGGSVRDDVADILPKCECDERGNPCQKCLDEAEAWEAGREERLQDRELFARGHGDL